jgi:hypothetical protein
MSASRLIKNATVNDSVGGDSDEIVFPINFGWNSSTRLADGTLDKLMT